VNIKSTGLFDYVLLDVRYTGNRPVIVLKVKEKSSSIVRLGLHADNEHSLVSTVDIRDANSRGAGEELGITMRYGFRDRQARLGYTISRIFNTYFTFNTGVYFTSRDVITYRDDPALRSGDWDRIENGKFKENKYGWTMAFGRQFERFGDVNAELRVENQQISAISGEGYTPERYRFVSLKLRSIVDTEDKFLFPTSGMFLALSYETALRNLGSEVGFGKVEATYETYLTFLPRHTLRPRVTFGFADATLPIAEQYTLGGFRSMLGLREDDSYGRQLFLVNMEYRFSLPFRVIFDTYVKARYDLGTISLIPEELKINSFRHGLGGEIALDTPVGEAAFGAGLSFYLKPGTPNSSMSFGPVLVYFSIGPRL
jgi:outer membrane protein assembly factor BamA